MPFSRKSTRYRSYGKIDKAVFQCSLEKEAKKFQLMGSYIKKKP